jgi:NTP pyrophosphatase (non-canonical NTP hydrolase)
MLMNMRSYIADFIQAMEANFPGMYDRFPLQPIAVVAEEAGEAVGAVRRALGLARRKGDWSEAEEELADVIISAYVAGTVYDLDLDAAVERKWKKIMSRGFKGQ